MSGNKCPQDPIPITFCDMKPSLLLDSLKKIKEEVQPVPVSFNCVKQELSDSQLKQHSGSQLLRHLLDIEENHALQPSPLPVLIPDIKVETQDSKFITTNLLPITKAEQIEAKPSTGPSWKPIHFSSTGMKCYYCGKESASSWHPECHKKFSSGETKPFYCRICSRNFSSKETLKCHLNFHFPYGTFRCDLCNKVSASKAYSKEHRKIHFPKDHHCNICFKILRNESTLVIHQISHRSGKTNKDFLCDICGYLCERISLLNTHISNVHSQKESIFVIHVGLE
uniref:C2H2-type domain-containing protein n=1 Tax=Timema monikensis TaxID=170555 RepID=A0A7R9E0S0_9NEOP|nr:unnamed protein product [Timema monikensis]